MLWGEKCTLKPLNIQTLHQYQEVHNLLKALKKIYQNFPQTITNSFILKIVSPSAELALETRLGEKYVCYDMYLTYLQSQLIVRYRMAIPS